MLPTSNYLNHLNGLNGAPVLSVAQRSRRKAVERDSAHGELVEPLERATILNSAAIELSFGNRNFEFWGILILGSNLLLNSSQLIESNCQS